MRLGQEPVEANPLIAAALADLNAFSYPLASSPAGKITSETLFRGETVGDSIGPYISQFLGRFQNLVRVTPIVEMKPAVIGGCGSAIQAV
jgi:hypothetical protein